MRPTDMLREEHRVIEQVLNCLQKLAADAFGRGTLDGAAAREVLDFLRNFADGCHHGKEEGILFPAMEARGFDRRYGPTGVMMTEHNLGRELLAGMEANLDAAAAGDWDATERFASLAAAYVRLLRDHILKEDYRLFPMAEQTFTAAEQEALLERFAAAEETEVGAGAHEHYLALADRLAD
ncbi:MAG TPA: hemerythrin domain-containing protein, partial [Gemmataceae bacterium]